MNVKLHSAADNDMRDELNARFESTSHGYVDESDLSEGAMM